MFPEKLTWATCDHGNGWLYDASAPDSAIARVGAKDAELVAELVRRWNAHETIEKVREHLDRSAEWYQREIQMQVKQTAQNDQTDAALGHAIEVLAKSREIITALLAACEALPLECEFMDAADYKDNALQFDRAMSLARAAIAKAKGGE